MSARCSTRSRSLITALAVVFAVAPTLYRAVVRFGLRYGMKRAKEGDVSFMLRAYSNDVRFVFPGRSSWADFPCTAPVLTVDTQPMRSRARTDAVGPPSSSRSPNTLGFGCTSEGTIRSPLRG